MPYDVITLDANSFIHNGINLESGLLAQLSQFREGPVDLVLSEIVTKEVLKHLGQNTKKGRDAALSSISRMEQLGLIEDVNHLKQLSDSLIDSRQAVRNRFSKFTEATGLELIPASLASIDEILKAYFGANPPFEASGEKKNEFPDAIALLSLDVWTKEKGKRLLAVSADKGWAQFADGHERIDVEADLGKALEILQEHTEAAELGVSRFLTALENGDAPEASSAIEEALRESLSDWHYHADGSGSFFLETNSTELSYKNYTLDRLGNDQFDITIVRMGEDSTVARIAATFEADAIADFSLSVWDGIDKEYVGMGSSSGEKEVEFDGSFLLTLYGDLNGDLTEIDVELELVDAIDYVDFGEIELDYGDYNDFDDLMAEGVDQDALADAEADGRAAAGADEPF